MTQKERNFEDNKRQVTNHVRVWCFACHTQTRDDSQEPREYNLTMGIDDDDDRKEYKNVMSWKKKNANS